MKVFSFTLSGTPLLPPNYPTFYFVHCAFHVPLCCVSVRSAAPDFHKLNEDGELWLVNQGLKETIRCKCVSNTSVIFEHDAFTFSQERMCFFIHIVPFIRFINR